jgi:hypothetical protein
VIVIYYLGWQISNKRSEKKERERVTNIRQIEANKMSGGGKEKDNAEAVKGEKV